MDQLFEHTLKRQMEAQSKEVGDLKTQVAELTTLLKGALVPTDGRGASAQSALAGLAQTADTINNTLVTNTLNVTQNTTVIQITPWDSDRRLCVGIDQILAVFSENAQVRKYTMMSDQELTDPEIAPPYVIELLMDLTKRAHANPAARNVYLNPRRADQVLVLKADDSWEVMTLLEATRLMFDDVTRDLRRVVMKYTELSRLPLEAQNALALANMMYGDDPEKYAKGARAPMAAHLANTAPQRGVGVFLTK